MIEDIVDWIMEIGLVLPIYLTMDSESKVVRVLGVLLCFGWLPVVALPMFVVVIVCFILDMIREI